MKVRPAPARRLEYYVPTSCPMVVNDHDAQAMWEGVAPAIGPDVSPRHA